MPMRGELAMPVSHSELLEDGLLPVLCFCTTGLFITLYFALNDLSFDQLALLLAQYNLFG